MAPLACPSAPGSVSSLRIPPGRRELLAKLFTDIYVMHGRVQGYSPRPHRAPNLIRKIDSIVAKLSVSVGGDGFEPTASSV